VYHNRDPDGVAIVPGDVEGMSPKTGVASRPFTPVECWRAVRRAHGPAHTKATLAGMLEGIILIRFDEALLRLATHIGPPLLRSLDAIHLAAALSIGDYPEAFITYDDRLAAAARKLKLHVIQPGR
jgi:hypothetical protein